MLFYDSSNVTGQASAENQSVLALNKLKIRT